MSCLGGSKSYERLTKLQRLEWSIVFGIVSEKKTRVIIVVDSQAPLPMSGQCKKMEDLAKEVRSVSPGGKINIIPNLSRQY